MSNADDSSRRAEEPAKELPRGDHKVGYRKPPVEHQFKPGNNANPKGRGKGSRNRKLVIEEVLFEPITVREGGIAKKMSVLEAIVKKMASKALTGDNKAALAIIGLAHKEGLLTPELEEAVEENLTDTDKAILSDFMSSLGVPQPDLAVQVPLQPRQVSAEEHSSSEATPPASPEGKITRPVRNWKF
jgi:hypothetical protein